MCDVEKLITHLIMTCNDEASFSAAESVVYGKLLRATIAFILEVGGGNILTLTKNHEIPLPIVLYQLL